MKKILFFTFMSLYASNMIMSAQTVTLQQNVECIINIHPANDVVCDVSTYGNLQYFYPYNIQHCGAMFYIDIVEMQYYVMEIINYENYRTYDFKADFIKRKQFLEKIKVLCDYSKTLGIHFT
jgi:hypothetical protein